MSYLDRLNLRPFEKRLVVGVGVVFFLVINALFVVPHFSDLGDAQKRRVDTLKKLNDWEAEIIQSPKYQAGIRKFISAGQDVPAEDQVNQFARAIQNQQGESGVGIPNFGRTTYSTNQFFVDLSQVISVQSGESQLVDFLYRLGSGNSLIRVRDLALKPDGPRQQLSGTVKLVASYQKNQPKKAAPGALQRSAAAPPATSTAKRP
jgi:hypothetical protein